MYRNVLITGVTAAAIVGAGTAAMAMSGSDAVAGSATAAGNATTSSAAVAGARHHHGRLFGKLRRIEHGSIVTKGKAGEVTHSLIQGSVTAVSPTSITVLAADTKSQTFTVTKDTKVRVRGQARGVTATIAEVAKGDHVFVTGTGTSTVTARHILDLGTK